MAESGGTGHSEHFSKALEYLRQAEASAPPAPAHFEDGISRRKRQNEVKLHSRVGNGALALMVAQLLIADTAFYIYGFYNAWDIPTAAITTWLAATVVQIVGVVLVIAKNLFPTITDP
jgi:hypothetical protein